MTFGKSVQTCFKKYFTFKGRASRSEYWWFCLFVWLIEVTASIVDQLLGMPIATYVCLSVLFFPSLAALVRRYHDSNHSSLWIWCPIMHIVLLFYKSDEGENNYGQKLE